MSINYNLLIIIKKIINYNFKILGDADLIVLPDPSQFGEAGFEGVANVGNTLLNHT